MYDTPRVTVPVEAVELLRRHMPMLEAAATPTKSEVFVVCGHEAREMHDAIAMLSAAPAPDGGAVQRSIVNFDVEGYVEGYEFAGDEGFYTPTEDERALLTDAIHGVLSELSLATREEAPAEAGALVSQIDALLAIPEANLSSRIPYLARELLERSAKHLRAQPQALSGGSK